MLNCYQLFCAEFQTGALFSIQGSLPFHWYGVAGEVDWFKNCSKVTERVFIQTLWVSFPFFVFLVLSELFWVMIYVVCMWQLGIFVRFLFPLVCFKNAFIATLLFLFHCVAEESFLIAHFPDQIVLLLGLSQFTKDMLTSQEKQITLK